MSEPVRVEVWSAEDMSPFHVAIVLNEKWLSMKPCKVVALFLKHYERKHGSAPEAAGYSLAVKDGPILDDVFMREAVKQGTVLRLSAKADEERDKALIEEEAFTGLVSLHTKLHRAEFKLHTKVIYGLVEGLITPDELGGGSNKEQQEAYGSVLGLIRQTDRLTLFRALTRFVTPKSALSVESLKKKLEDPLRWALAREVYCAKVFMESAPKLRAKLRQVESQKELPRREEVMALFDLEIPLRTRWRPKWFPTSRTADLLKKTPEETISAELTVPEMLVVAQPSRFVGEFTAVGYFAENVYGSREILTYEGVVALATYLKERLAIKPIGYRDLAVEMNAGSGRLAHMLRRVGRGKLEGTDHDFNVIPTELRPMDASSEFGEPPERLDLNQVIQIHRPAVVVCAWNYRAGLEDWLLKCKESVPDPDDFKLDVPEIVLIGPSSELLAADLACTDPHKKPNKTDDEDHKKPAPPRHDPLLPWKHFEGYERVHLDHISRHLLHVADLDTEKYGHACCVSFRSTGQPLSEFRTLNEIAKSKAAGRIAQAQAEAKRGVQFTDSDIRELMEAQKIIDDPSLT